MHEDFEAALLADKVEQESKYSSNSPFCTPFPQGTDAYMSFRHILAHCHESCNAYCKEREWK